MSKRVRAPAVSGAFYPADSDELRATVEGLLAEARSREAERSGADGQPTLPKAMVAPHAGYAYSGPVAASTYARLEGADIQRVVLLGPAHRWAFQGLALPDVEAFATPLGEVALDTTGVSAALESPHVRVLDEAHHGEHSLEVHLPFLQITLEEFTLVPLVVGDASAGDVAEVLRLLWGGSETLVVVSSDLSHFLSYDEALEIDGSTAAAIEALAPEAIQSHQACGRIPLGGLLMVAAERGLRAHTDDLRNSGDTAGPRDRVVGYGAWAFTE
ncbi:MAG: AmmeMemoRadiSam system protein B [Gemmatimonadetes bacterium]|nr:AmmeMemoRadiSam system protein B [Gemmatimonadota bacterium]